MRLFWEEQQSSQNNATYHPMNLNTDVTRQSIYLVLTNVLSTSFLMFHITFNEISTTLSIQFWYKGRYNRYIGAMICSHFGIAFLMFFIEIENAVYTSCQNSTRLLINGLIFDIMITQNNQSLDFELKTNVTTT